jgi:hypothetical protein
MGPPDGLNLRMVQERFRNRPGAVVLPGRPRKTISDHLAGAGLGLGATDGQAGRH